MKIENMQSSFLNLVLLFFISRNMLKVANTIKYIFSLTSILMLYCLDLFFSKVPVEGKAFPIVVVEKPG